MNETFDKVTFRKLLTECVAQMNRYDDALPNTFHEETNKLHQFLKNLKENES